MITEEVRRKIEEAAELAAKVLFESLKDENDEADAVEVGTAVALMFYKTFNMTRDEVGLEDAQKMLCGVMDCMILTYNGGFNSKYQEKDEADCRD
jgi:hypothetical protein